MKVPLAAATGIGIIEEGGTTVELCGHLLVDVGRVTKGLREAYRTGYRSGWIETLKAVATATGSSDETLRDILAELIHMGCRPGAHAAPNKSDRTKADRSIKVCRSEGWL